MDEELAYEATCPIHTADGFGPLFDISDNVFIFESEGINSQIIFYRYPLKWWPLPVNTPQPRIRLVAIEFYTFIQHFRPLTVKAKNQKMLLKLRTVNNA